MKRLRRFKSVLLVVAAGIAGCGTRPIEEAAKVSAPTAKAMSCTERSAAARPPKHPIVELAWCIAETDDLYDPDHLFHQTLDIKSYSTSQGITWGVQAMGGGTRDFQHLPEGIIDFLFQRKDLREDRKISGRYIGFGIDPKKSCVSLQDIFTTFGHDFKKMAVPVRTASPASPGIASESTPKSIDLYGVFYKSPGQFSDSASAFVQFTFDYRECAKHVSIQRNYFSIEKTERKK